MNEMSMHLLLKSLQFIAQRSLQIFCLHLEHLLKRILLALKNLQLLLVQTQLI